MLNADQIEVYEQNPLAVAPKCMVCGDDIPLPRSRDSRHSTCSKDCHDLLKKYRKQVDNLKYCPSCLHPNTPEQREEFRKWRMDRGDKKSHNGRPFRQYERRLIEAMTKVIGTLKSYEYELLLNHGIYSAETGEKTIEEPEAGEALAKLKSQVTEIQKLLDNPE
jgi:hypothetical protein